MPPETDVEWLICTTKTPFHSKAKARRHARDNQWRWGRQWPYDCKVCGRVHLTSKNPNRSNRQAEHVQDNKTDNV